MNRRKLSSANLINPVKTQKEKKSDHINTFYSSLLNSINEAIIVTQGEKFVYINSQFCIMLGYEAVELYQMNYQNVFSLHTIDFLYEREILRAQGIDVPSSYETMLKRKDGSLVDVEVNINFLSYKNRPAVVSVIRDIKKRKSFEKKLIERENVLRTIMNFTPSALFIIKGERFVYINKAAERVCGYNPGELKMKKFWNIIHPDYKELVRMREIARQKGFNVTNHYEFKIVNPDGEEVWLDYMASQIHVNGEAAVLGTALDITKRKTAEEALIEKQYQLEQKTEELAELNKKLHQSEQKLLELNANKDKFFSIISHDLKSPFSSLIGFSEMLAKEFDKMDRNDIKVSVENMYRSASGIYNLLENLLQWSRIQTDRIEFSPVSFKFNDLILQVIDIFKSNARNKNISIINRVKKTISVYADKNMIDTILRNLLSNAIKFTPQNGRIIFSANIKKDNVIFSISNTGAAMDIDTKLKLFRIDEVITREGTDKEKGTGLGLILCKEFVEKNGGKIWVDSKTVKGSKFYFSVPAG